MHPYEAARRVLAELHKIFLQHGHRNWSVSPTKDGKENFAHVGLDEAEARKALLLLVSKRLAEHRGTIAFVITEYGVRVSDHATQLEDVLPIPHANADPDPATGDSRATPNVPARTPLPALDEFVPADLRERFTAVHHIGGGSFGNVYQVVDRESLQRLALKVTIPAPDARARAKREADVMRTLRHPNVMTALELHPDGEWFVFPLAEGTLGQLKAWDRVTDDDALALARDVGSALEHAHAKGVRHRDLHVDNILRFDGRWVVADWGLAVARGSDRLTRTRSVGGIATWTAPEQIVALKNADERSDLFSLGRLVQWLASGRLPDDDRPGVLADGHPLAAFVERLTQLDPSDRPTSATSALELLPSREPVPRRAVERAAGPGRRPPTPISQSEIERLEGRHRARVGDLLALQKDSPSLKPGPMVILHVWPSDEKREVDLLPLKQSRFDPLPPVAHLHWDVRFNHDGIAASCPENPPASWLVHISRSGAIELADTYMIQRIHAPEPVLFPLNLEREVVGFVEHWASTVLEPLGVHPPRVVTLTLAGINGFELHLHERSPVKRKTTFDRDIFTFAPVVLADDSDVRSSLKSLFDRIWQAAGEDRSLGYSRSGEWLDDVHRRR
ncbi:MAG: serine/threonine protein kinase [Labilithrix sp.]|nr:serine/threonine protein kinase [Labilithrix sp.]MCW5811546.1 serine/threonine protein kinase [Labilithrix sp.]